METSLHRQLKERYAEGGGLTEQKLGRYRIDVVRGTQLVEIQLSSLSSIRDKIRTLLKKHDVLVVKPIIMRKHLVKRKREGGEVVSRRRSPKQRTLLDIFEELVHFTRVLAIIDRLEGGREAFAARGYELTTLFTIRDFGITTT